MTQYLPYIVELRRRLIQSTIAFLGLFALLFWQDERLYVLIAKPLLTLLPAGSRLVALEVTSSFTVPMKAALVTAFFLGVPYFFYQVWAFISPALYRHERKAIFPIAVLSILLFYLGSLFAYAVICPLALQFFIGSTPPEISLMTDIRYYLDFVSSLLLAGGLAFQVPVVIIIVLRLKWVTVEQLIYLRPYVIVGAFIIGMLLTPPDVISQTLVALPMWGLFELGILFARKIPRR